ncbi:uncharacterized protein LOC143253859 [Tachypleus tridentatus]|uniref:uncharacterized protein LOC143253859 n=1 Tax=Tachypleus tridentatus TaxID=6853 RepID=UPI003FD35998
MDSKHRNQRNRRRERALRIQRQKLAAQGRGLGNGASGEEGDESPNRLKPQRPPNRRKRNKEPMFEEDIIDGFSILSFRSYEDLENDVKMIRKSVADVHTLKDFFAMVKLVPQNRDLGRTVYIIQCNKNSFNQDSTLLSSKSEKSKKKSENVLNISRISPNKLNVDQNDSGVTSDDNFRFREEVNDSHSVTPIQLSDVSNHSTSGSGYMCDSESEEDKGSNSGSDLFTAVQRELSPTLRNKNVLPENSRLSPNFKYPLQNGSLGDEPMNSSSPEPVLSSAAGLTSKAVCVSTPELPFLTNKVTINGSSVSATSELRENCPSPPCLSPIISGVLPNSDSNFSISRTKSLNASSLSGGSKKNNGPVSSPTNSSKSLPILTTPVSHTSLQGKNAFPVINGVKTSISSSDLSGLSALPKTSVPVSSSSFPFCISSSHAPQELPPPISTTALSRSAPLPSSTLVCSSHISHTPSTFVNSQPTSSVIQNSFPNHHSSLNLSLTTHSKTSTLTGSRDSHSNSSVSSLSQMSHSLHSNNKESTSSRGNTPALSASSAAALGGHDPGVSNNTTSCAYTVASYGSTSLVFTKSHSWGRSNASPIRGSNGPTLTRSGGSSASIPLPPSLSTNHHSSPFGNLPGHSTLHPVIFGPASLAASGSPGGPSTYVSGDGIYPQPNADFLRRELDTRFLVSHDRTLGIHPPPFMRPEHHHHHHQHSPFLPPHLGVHCFLHSHHLGICMTSFLSWTALYILGTLLGYQDTVGLLPLFLRDI